MQKDRFTFIISHLFHLSLRSIGIIVVGIIFMIVGALSLFIYRNTISAIEYYTPSDINEKRVVLSKEAMIFDIFAKNGGGISDELVQNIKDDPIFERTRMFSFVETNILGGFDIFQFHFDVDIPVFSLDDSAGELTGFGISPSMMHYYNLELAGSHPLFPQVDPDYLRGKKISLTFGASKIFDLSSPPSSPLLGSITRIESDFPGFGIVAAKSEVDAKLREIGASVRAPYKIIAYMRDESDRSLVAEKYASLHPVFDRDRLEERERQNRAIFLSIFGVGVFFESIVIGLILLLLFGFFREKKNAFVLTHVYGIRGFSRHVLVAGEATVLILLGVISGSLGVIILQYFFTASLSSYFISQGILFPLYSLSYTDIGSLSGVSFLVLFTLMTLIMMNQGMKNKFL